MPDSAPAEIDIAIAPDDVGRMEEALRNRTDTQVVQLLEYEASCYCFILAVRDRTDVRFMALDTAMEYRQEGCVFFAAQDLVGLRRRVNGLWVAAPENEFAYLLVKKILKRTLAGHQRARLQALCALLGEGADVIARRLLGPSAGTQLVKWLTEGEWDTLEAQLGRFRRVLLWQTIKRDPSTPIRYWVPELGRRWRRWAHPTGMCVVVLGPDAAERQLLISRLSRDLSGAFRHIAVVPLRPPGERAVNDDELFSNRNGAATRLHRFFGVFKNAYALLAAAAKYLVRVRPCLVRSSLVLVDCALEDVPRDLLQSQHRGAAVLARRLAHLPDLFLIVNTPERQSHLPLPGRPKDELPRQERWRSIGAYLPNAALVDGTVPIDGAAESARDVVLDYLRRRYLHRRALWFPDKRAESLRWLSSVICASPAARFVSAREQRNGAGVPDSRTSPFGRISLKDGRGYLIPLESRLAAVKSLDLYNAKPLKARLAKKLLALALRLGVGGYCLPQVNLVKNGRSSESEADDATLVEYLKHMLGRNNLVTAISLGTPSYHRKPVLLALSADGAPLAYVKVGSTDITNALVQHEAETLQYLATGSFNSFTSPRVLHAGWWNGRYVCVQSVLTEGRAQPVSERLARRHVDIAQEFATTNLYWSSLQESNFWRQLLQQAGLVAGVAYRDPLSRGIHRVEQRLDGVDLPFHFGHGDFAPWNMKAFKDKIVVFDWERASKEALPGWDLFHFMFEIMRVQGRDPWDMCRAFFGDEGFRSGADEYFCPLSLGVGIQCSLLQLYLLARLARWAVDVPGHAARFRDLQTLVRLLQMLERRCGAE